MLRIATSPFPLFLVSTGSLVSLQALSFSKAIKAWHDIDLPGVSIFPI